MKRILFVAPYPEGKAPSQRLKYEQYYPYFREAGYEITTSSFIDAEFWEVVYKPGNTFRKILFTIQAYFRRIGDLVSLGKYDIVYVHLWVTPIGPPLFEWLFRKFSKRMIYDIDDLIFLKPKSKSNPLINWLKSSNKSIFLMKKADHVITCTPHLDTFVRQFNHRTTDISSTINTKVYQPRQDYSEKGKITLGWSGSHSTSKYVYLLKDVFLKLKEEMDFRLLVIGDKEFKMEGIDVTAIPWTESSEVADLSQIDIGLYPLPNEEWVLGKSGLKALQYMALGIPTIATAIGANFRVIEQNVSGFLVNEHEEWLQAIRALAKDETLRRSIGSAAAERVEKHYSINANVPVYLNILDKVVKKNS
ncbi:a-glycosyltransferase [Rufibacter radiotolerans]|uniref:A-glycosyltransferase n=1 Tax=Rufibacter radiotolerans TaxID=1379910 RepID=A0A0H4VM30_9BACT|nr:glycosyltransferase family 4 protein [Rufibacter radiotolerans]AKQ44804.1 a-glycosyltransferase [Rufibacter radiotolerans]